MPHRLAAYFKKAQQVKSSLINICCGFRGLSYAETGFLAQGPVLPIFRSPCECDWVHAHLSFSLVGLSVWLRPSRWLTEDVSGNTLICTEVLIVSCLNLTRRRFQTDARRSEVINSQADISLSAAVSASCKLMLLSFILIRQMRSEITQIIFICPWRALCLHGPPPFCLGLFGLV